MSRQQARLNALKDHAPVLTKKEIFAEMQSILDDSEMEIARLNGWVNDLQSGMYINCVYCGHRYGPQEDTPVSMADVLKQHIEICPDHPMSRLKIENESFKTRIAELENK